MTQAGTTYGRYRLLESIGRGSIAEAFKAKSFGVEGFEKTLVVKRVLPELAANVKFVEAFVQEAKLAVRLSHANVVQVVDLGRVDEPSGASFFLTSEHVDGLDWATLLARLRRAGVEPALELCLFVAAEVAKGLDHAHRRRDDQLRLLGIIHGDVSPRNVLVSWDGEVKLSDFCIGRALYAALPPNAGALSAKYPYASPEQARGQPLTAASDLFGFGSFLYESLSGKNPFLVADASEGRKLVAEPRVPALAQARPDLPESLASLVARALAPEPDQRFASAAEIHEELLTELYARGSRYDAAELAELVERYREARVVAEPVQQALERESETPPPSRRDVRPPVSSPRASLASLPPLTGGLADRREVSVLGLHFASSAPAATRERARQVILRYGGRLLEDSARDIAAVFGLEQQDGRDTETAVRGGLVAIRSLANSPIALSAGVEAGRIEVLADGTPNPKQAQRLIESARRLASIAPWRLAIAERCERELRDSFTLELPPASAGDAGGWLIGEERPLHETFEAFVGRRAELRRLGELLAAASRRSAQVVGLVGEAGVGKTRLVYEMERRIGKSSFDIAIYVASCPPRGHEIPNSAIVSMLRTLCGVHEGDAGELLSGVEPRLRALGLRGQEVEAVLGELGATPTRERAVSSAPLSGAVTRMLQSLAKDRLQLFAWDDAQEMDAESAALLSEVVSRLAQSRVMLLFAARPREGASYRSIQGYSEVALGDLAPDDAFRLVALRLGADQVPEPLLEFVRVRAGGHPMFIEELLHEAVGSGAVAVRQGRVEARLDGALSVPRPLRTLLADRVRRLPEAERELAVSVAILDAPAETSVLAAMLGSPLAHVTSLAESLVERELLRFAGPLSVSFRSPLLPEILLSGLEPDGLVELNRRAARAYEVALGDKAEQESGRIARHLAEAGERLQAAHAFAKSGLQALSARRLDRAAADLARALELALLEERPCAEIIDWISALSRAVRHVRSGARLPELAQRLTARLERDRSVPPRLRVQTAIDLSLLLGHLHHYKDARRLLQRAAAVAGPWPELKRAALTAEAEIAIQLGEFKRALKALGDVQRLSAGDAFEQHRVLVATAQALGGAGEHQRALDALDQAAALVSDEDPVLRFERTKVRALILGFHGDWRGCAEASADAAEQGRSAGFEYEVAVNLHNEGDALLRIGELPRAYASLQASLSVAEQLGSERLVNLDRMLLAYLDALKGSEPAARVLGEGLAHAELRKWTWDALTGRYLLGKLFAERGEAGAARRELELARQMALGAGNQPIADDCGRELEALDE